MKNILLVATLFAAFTSSRSYAQQNGDLIANIPFAFRVGPTNMPAGIYVVRQKDNMLCVRQTDHWGTCIAGFATSAPAEREKGVLLFHRYENTYFLASTWAPVSQTGIALSRSKAETEVAKRVGSMQSLALTIK
jgi:hypothetical protein